MLRPLPPPLERFLADFGDERVWVQALIRRTGAGFELRHVIDRDAAPTTLREIPPDALRDLAQTTAAGLYRPLKCAPDLPAGWRSVSPGPEGLAHALHALYPGTLGDWYAAAVGIVQPADYATVAARQLGRGRVIESLQGDALAAVVETTCHPGSCLKFRRWTAAGVPADVPAQKSVVPCLEPCPMFRRFARTCADLEAGSTVSPRFAPDDLATLAAALRHVLEHRPPDLRLGEVAAPLHPWRVARLLARWRDAWSPAPSLSHDADD